MLSAVRSAGQHAAGGAGNREQLGARRDALAVLDRHLDREGRIVVPKYHGGDLDAGHRHRLACVHPECAIGIRVDHDLAGQVAGADVLGEPEVDQPVDQIWIKHRAPLYVYKR